MPASRLALKSELCSSVRRSALPLAAACLLVATAGTVYGQPAEPAPPAGQPPAKVFNGPTGRRPVSGEPTVLAFKQVTVDKLLDFIVEATGKVVLPQQDILTSKKITIVNDRPIPREQALDLVFQALAQNGVGVVETENTIVLRAIEDISKQDVPVIGPDTSVLTRTDMGTLVQKVFSLKNSSAKNVGEIIKDAKPDFAQLAVDEESNQVAITGPISFVQRIERLVNSLDRPSAAALTAATFKLKYADAEAIKTNIDDLFGGGASKNRTQQNQQNQRRQEPVFRFPGQGGGEQTSTANTDEVRVTANTQQNSVTVVADPAILQQIRDQIENHWDLALPEEAVVPRTYDLKNSDPIKVRDALEGLFGRGNPQAGRGAQQGGPGGGQTGTSSSGSSQGVGRLAGQFSFQALPDSGRLVVVSKSVDNLSVIDKIIQDLDQPQSVGLPAIVELRHASAEDLAEQINALLAQDGTLASIRRSEQGLSAGSANISPFSAEQSTATTSTTTAEDQTASSETLSFWWQRSRTPTDRRPPSNLIGQLRIVPVWRQNALMVVAPPEYKQNVVDLIEMLDKPGRQVLISAVVAEVSSDDALSFGLRWSSQTITPTNADNSISLGTTAQGTRNNWATSLFDTSVLNANANLNVLLQALNEKQAVRILSEPKVFTADNQETSFFDGQDVSVPTSSNTSSNGTVTQTFDYRAVGLQLRARPRITVKGDVDLRVDLQLSSIAPGAGPNGSFIFDRRQTTTQLIVRDGQTVVISGLLRNELTDIVRKVPLLGDIPLLGWIFKSKDKEARNTELLIFITPVVVNNTEAMQPLNEPYNQRLQRLRTDLSDSEGKPRPPEVPVAGEKPQ